MPKSVNQLKDDLFKIAKEWRDWFNLEREVGVYVDWVEDVNLGEGWRSPCNPGNAFTFPFGPDYWILSVRGCSAELESILP